MQFFALKKEIMKAQYSGSRQWVLTGLIMAGIALAACGCKSMQTYPSAILKDDTDVAEFNYALQLFDMKHRNEARSAIAMDTLFQTNL